MKEMKMLTLCEKKKKRGGMVKVGGTERAVCVKWNK